MTAFSDLVVDARMARHGGIGRYVRGLLGELVSREDGPRLTLLAPTRGGPGGFELPGARRVAHDAPIYGLREQLAGAWICRTRCPRGAVFHFPHYNVPWLAPRRSVVTVHDLTHFYGVSGHAPGRVVLARALLRRAARRARRVIAVSQATADELARFAPQAAGRIDVVHHGVDAVFRPRSIERVQAFRRERRVGGPCLLFVGSDRPHKNLGRLLRAFAALRSSLRAELVLVGTLRERVEGEGIRAVGAIDDEELSLWYNAADVHVVPSLNEGFGLTVLESMACGTPVAASRVPALTEVAAGATLEFDPTEGAAIRDCLQRLLADEVLRGELREKGLARAAGFRWSHAVDRTLAVYRRALEST